MFDFVPLDIYTAVYYHVMFLVMCMILVLSVSFTMGDFQSISLSNFLGYGLLILVTLYMGLRQTSGYHFGDMGGYDDNFRKLQLGYEMKVKNDYLFNYFLIFCSKLMTVHTFFLLVDVIYILPCYLFAKKYCGTYWMYVFFMFLGSFSFWTFGTNGIRNGMATALFILALYYYDRKILLYSLLAIAIGVHKSLIITVAAFLVSGIYKNPKLYLYIWFAAIPLSLAGGGFWGGLFSGIFSGDSRAADYLTKGNVNNDNFSSSGFRWDFVFYSSFAVFSGWYFIFKKKIEDRFYTHLWGIFMIANAFWILVIRANFSNRFAYLSWFLMAPVIAYPLFKYKIFNDQFKVAGMVLAAYYLFTYLMFLKS